MENNLSYIQQIFVRSYLRFQIGPIWLVIKSDLISYDLVVEKEQNWMLEIKGTSFSVPTDVSEKKTISEIMLKLSVNFVKAKKHIFAMSWDFSTYITCPRLAYTMKIKNRLIKQFWMYTIMKNEFSSYFQLTPAR